RGVTGLISPARLAKCLMAARERVGSIDCRRSLTFDGRERVDWHPLADTFRERLSHCFRASSDILRLRAIAREPRISPRGNQFVLDVVVRHIGKSPDGCQDDCVIA